MSTTKLMVWQRETWPIRGVPHEIAVRWLTNWNWRNLRMLSKMDLPHITDFSIDEKLSSKMTMAAGGWECWMGGGGGEPRAAER